MDDNINILYPNKEMYQRICKNIAIKLKEIRLKNNMSQGELSLEADCAKSYIGMIENGQKIPSIKLLTKLATALKIDIRDFF